jgi:putative Holliday junction resolvase
MRYIGIDYGSSKVGLALSDENGQMGFPHGIVPNTPRLLETVAILMQDENVGAAVIGESRDLAGGENAIAKAAHEFGDALAARTGAPVYYEDESFTSAEARHQYDRTEKSRAPLAQAAVDASAAALILTSYLSKHHG